MKIIIKFILLLFILTSISYANKQQKVLILHSYHQSYKWTDDINRGIKSILSNGNSNLEFFVEYMDSKRFIDKKHYEYLFFTYLNKYKDIKFDAIIASDNNAFNFLKNYDHGLFKGSPVVLCGVNYIQAGDLKNYTNYTAVNEQADIKENFDLIMKLHPDTKNIYIVTDTTTTGKRVKSEAQKIIFNYPNRKTKFFITDDVTYDELKLIIQSTPPNSVILFTIFFRDKNNKFYEYYEISNMISKNTTSPIYGLWDFSLDNGIIGGFLTSGYFQGRAAANMAKQILKGEKVQNIPVLYKSPNEYMFDYSQLEKFNVDTSKLPLASYIINKKDTFYEIYKREILTLAFIFVFMIIFIIVLLINIKKRQNAEARISKQLKFQQELIDSVDAPIYYKNREEEYIGCNKAFERFLKKDKKDIIGKTAHDMVRKKYADIYHTKDSELIETGIAQRYEGVHEYANGEKKNLIFYKNAFYDEDTVQGIIGAIFDITELKRVSSELDTLNKNLEKKVEDRTIELKHTNEELEDSNEKLQTTIAHLKQTQEKLVESEKMASLGSLVAGVAHEINTPVGIGLTGITHLIQERNNISEDYDKGEMTEERFKSFLDTLNELGSLINTNLSRTAKLIKSFKQISVDQTRDELREINLKEYIEDILFSISNITNKTKLNIEVKAPQHIRINTFPGALSQVITNLVMNSITHAYEKNEKGNISIEVIQDEDKFKILYKDDGKGIKEEHLDKIFDPFFTTNRGQGGSGLGLNIIYNIVANTLKGTISCKSEENKGVEFIIIFKPESIL